MTMKLMKLRQEFKFELPQGQSLNYKNYEANIQAVAKIALPGKAVEVFDDSFLTDELTIDELAALENAFSQNPVFCNWRICASECYFCDMDGNKLDRAQFYHLAAEENRLARGG